MTASKAKTAARRRRSALGRVLLAEDDAVLALALEDALLRGGASAVVICSSMAATVRALDDGQPFDAVVLDVHLADRDDGWAVAELIAGLPGHVNLDTMPWVIYTEPEIAWVGKTEKELKDAGIPYRAGSFPFAAIGRAVAMNEPYGMVKMLAHADTDRILGVHMVGPGVSELIAECVVAMEFKGSSEDIARIVHAHPTLSEAVHEAALAVDKRAIHKAN